MSEHTPGPWTAEIKGNGGFAVFAPGGMACIAEVFTGVLGPTDRDATEANARLIAAAPDLLAALEAAMRISDLWLPATPSENPSEDLALAIMHAKFAEALKAAKGE